MFQDQALAEAGVGAKVHRIVQAIFAAATGVVRLRHHDTIRAIQHRQRSTPGGHLLSEDWTGSSGCMTSKTQLAWGEYDHHVEVRVCR